MPIKTRIDMLATGIKTPVGIKIAGPDLAEIDRLGQAVERAVMQVPGTVSAYSERITGGRYIEIRPDRVAAARFGLNIDDINEIVAVGLGGVTVTRTVEGLERYPVNLRFPRERRGDLEQTARTADRHPVRRPGGAGSGRRGRHRRWRAHDQERKRARSTAGSIVDIRGRDLGVMSPRHKPWCANRCRCRPVIRSPGRVSSSTCSAPRSGWNRSCP